MHSLTVIIRPHHSPQTAKRLTGRFDAYVGVAP
jgi:hypothetical protein